MRLLLFAGAFLFRHPAKLFGLPLKKRDKGGGDIAGQRRQILMKYVSQGRPRHPFIWFQGLWMYTVGDELLPNPQYLNRVRDTIAANKLLGAHLPHALDVSERHNALWV